MTFPVFFVEFISKFIVLPFRCFDVFSFPKLILHYRIMLMVLEQLVLDDIRGILAFTRELGSVFMAVDA